MKRNQAASIVMALGAIAATASCGDQGPPTPGTVTISLITPATDDGALKLRITGPGLASAKAASTSQHVFYRLATPEELGVIVVGNLSAGPILTVDVGDIKHPELYAGTVVEVAARNDVKRLDVTGYTLTIQAPR